MIRPSLCLLLLLALAVAACTQGQPATPTALPLPTAAALPTEAPAAASPTAGPEPLRQLFAPAPAAEQSLLGVSQLDRLLADQGAALRSTLAASHGAAIEALCSGQASFVWLTARGYLAAQARCPDVQLLFAVQRASAAADPAETATPGGVVAASAAVAPDAVRDYQAALAAVAASAEGRAALEAIGGWGEVSAAADGLFDPLRHAIAAAGVADLAAWPGVSQPLRVGLVTDGGRIDDGSLNQGAYQGLQQAAADFDLDLNFIETVQPEDFERNIAAFADAGYDLIVTVGPAMAQATQQLAGQYPAIRFVALDAALDEAPANVQRILFREDQAGFLAGVLAGQLSRSQTVGVVSGPETPAVRRYSAGFAQGVALVCPTCEVLSVAIDSADDPSRGRAAALGLIAQGADLIFGLGGATGAGALQGAAHDGAWVIGADRDAWLTVFDGGALSDADRLLTSAVKAADVAVYAAIVDAVMGRAPGGVRQLDLVNGGVGLTPWRDAALVPAAVQAKLQETLRALASGELDTGVDPDTGDIRP